MQLIFLLEVVAAKLAVELLDAACGVDELLLAGVERVAIRTDVHLHVTAGRTSLEGVAASASNVDAFIVWVCFLLNSFTSWV